MEKPFPSFHCSAGCVIAQLCKLALHRLVGHTWEERGHCGSKRRKQCNARAPLCSLFSSRCSWHVLCRPPALQERRRSPTPPGLIQMPDSACLVISSVFPHDCSRALFHHQGYQPPHPAVHHQGSVLLRRDRVRLPESPRAIFLSFPSSFFKAHPSPPPHHRPTLKHQRVLDNVKKDYDSLEARQIRGVKKDSRATRYRKGACQNCGAMTHTKTDCLERPRKIGAKYTNSDIAPDEHLPVSRRQHAVHNTNPPFSPSIPSPTALPPTARPQAELRRQAGPVGRLRRRPAQKGHCRVRADRAGAPPAAGRGAEQEGPGQGGGGGQGRGGDQPGGRRGL
jgi:hypothetical protein